MSDSGVLITLFDKETLALYLEKGVYGQHMTYESGEPSTRGVHYRTLADYGCCRGGNHVFFFLDREIYYGGRLLGPKDRGAFFLNGPLSPMGRTQQAPLVWDESRRDRYEFSGHAGRFHVPQSQNPDREVCQPYLIRFEDRGDELAGTFIVSDQLYFELGKFSHPLPSNSMRGMGFRTITPGETRILMKLLETEPEGELDPSVAGDSRQEVTLTQEPVQFETQFGLGHPSEARSEAHLEAATLANPGLLPPAFRPIDGALCRQVPVSPLKPTDLDLADICYFGTPEIESGTLPNKIVELKHGKAGKQAALQVKRYLLWLQKLLGPRAEDVAVKVFAPDYTSTFEGYIPDRFADQVEKQAFDPA